MLLVNIIVIACLVTIAINFQRIFSLIHLISNFSFLIIFCYLLLIPALQVSFSILFFIHSLVHFSVANVVYVFLTYCFVSFTCNLVNNFITFLYELFINSLDTLLYYLVLSFLIIINFFCLFLLFFELKGIYLYFNIEPFTVCTCSIYAIALLWFIVSISWFTNAFIVSTNYFNSFNYVISDDYNLYNTYIGSKCHSFVSYIYEFLTYEYNSPINNPEKGEVLFIAVERHFYNLTFEIVYNLLSGCIMHLPFLPVYFLAVIFILTFEDWNNLTFYRFGAILDYLIDIENSIQKNTINVVICFYLLLLSIIFLFFMFYSLTVTFNSRPSFSALLINPVLIGFNNCPYPHFATVNEYNPLSNVLLHPINNSLTLYTNSSLHGNYFLGNQLLNGNYGCQYFNIFDLSEIEIIYLDSLNVNHSNYYNMINYTQVVFCNFPELFELPNS